MLSVKAITAKVPSLILRGCYHQVPASSVAFSRIISARQCRRHSSSNNSTPSQPRFFATKSSINTSYAVVRRPHAALIEQRRLSTHPICDPINANIAKDLTPEEYDQAYKFLYHQHSHPHGPWLKFLHNAQKVLDGTKSPRILVLASGPGEPAATLAANFPDAEVTSAHSTMKCIQWASHRFQKLGLSNIFTRLLPDMEDLSAFKACSFDLVVAGYGLANVSNPKAVLNEIHRVLAPGGTLLSAVWEQAPADVACDIILRHSCIGPNPFHTDFDGKDVVGTFKCPVRTKHPTALGKPHLLETMIEDANMSVKEVTTDEYPLKLGKTKEFAFKVLTLPIRAELTELQQANHFHSDDAAEAFEDVLKEGFMVKIREDGELEVPYNTYKFVVARREFEDSDTTDRAEATKNKSLTLSDIQATLKPTDVRQDPIIFDTWNRMKPAASDKIYKVLKKILDGYKRSKEVKVLDAAPCPYTNTSVAIAADYPNASVEAISKSLKVVEEVRELALARGLQNLEARNLDPMNMATIPDKSCDIIVCSFGLTFLSSPEDTLKQFRRVLKPGGTLIISVWEDFALRQLSDSIIAQMHASGELEDFADTGSLPNVLGQLLPYAKPHELENVITKHGFDISHIDHETARIILSEPSCKTAYGENIATLAIRPFLHELEKNGENKNAFKDAKRAFESVLRDPSLVTRDKCGNLVVSEVYASM
jgi:ubiquinone/menaquinone biosynthesis C-methylase UbiE